MSGLGRWGEAPPGCVPIGFALGDATILPGPGRPRGPLRACKDLQGPARTCKDLQERLGAINDAALAAGMTSRLAEVAARSTLAPAFGAVSAWSEGRGTGHLRRLPDAWSRFKALRPPMH